MKALVTGASGFLGGRLVEVLRAQGAEVRVLVRRGAPLPYGRGSERGGIGTAPVHRSDKLITPVRRSDESPALVHRSNESPALVHRSDESLLSRDREGAVDVIEGNLGDREILATAAENVTHIFHCAAKSTDWATWREYYESNVEGTENLLKAAAKAGKLERFLHISTTDVYGYPTIPCDEDHETVDAGLPYNKTKILGEQAVRKSDLPWTVVRPATIYGPKSVTFGSDIAKLLRQRLMAVVDGGRATGGFLYVDNAIDAILTAATSPNTIGRIYNLSDGTGATWRTFVDTLADGLKIPRPWINLPSTFALALANVMEAPHRIGIPGRPLLTRHAVMLLARDQEFPIDRARRELGFEPKVSFEEGMRRMVAWLGSAELNGA